MTRHPLRPEGHIPVTRTNQDILEYLDGHDYNTWDTLLHH